MRLCIIVQRTIDYGVFKTKGFARFAKAERISDQTLAAAIARAERGLIDADLGGVVIKQRVARPGKGKSGGYRTLIAFHAGERAVYLFGFAKNERDNIGDDQVSDLKNAARDILGRSEDEFAVAIAGGQLQEIDYDP